MPRVGRDRTATHFQIFPKKQQQPEKNKWLIRIPFRRLYTEKSVKKKSISIMAAASRIETPKKREKE